MPWRITEYSMEIIKSAIYYSKIKQKDYKIPLVIPIVIYTGKTKWNIKSDIKEIQESLEGYQELGFGKYVIDDINDYTEEKLLKEKTYLSKVMLIEKYKKGDNLSECLDKIVKEVNGKRGEYKEEGRDVLLILVDKILKRKLGEEKADEITRKIKEGKVDMLQIFRTIDEENEDLIQEGRQVGRQEGRQEGRQLGRQEGRQEGKKQRSIEIAKKLLKMNFSIEQIEEITGLKKKIINLL